MNAHMETCRRVEALLFAWADGALGQADRAFVEAHLAACAPCFNRSRWEAAAKRLAARQAPLTAMPSGLEVDIRRALDSGAASAAPKPRRFTSPFPAFFRRPIFALAALLLAAVVVSVFMMEFLRGTPGERQAAMQGAEALVLTGALVCVGCEVHGRENPGIEVCHYAGIATPDGRIVPLYVHGDMTPPWAQDLHAALGAPVRVRGRMIEGMSGFLAEEAEFI